MTGLTITRRRLVDKQMTFEAGDPLSLPAITEVQRKLYNLGVFAKIDTAIQNPGGTTEYKHVLYDFEEAHRYAVNVGFGAEIAQFGGTTTSLNNPGGATGFSPRGSLEISRLNFLRNRPHCFVLVAGIRSGAARVDQLPGPEISRCGRPQHYVHAAVRQHAGCPDVLIQTGGSIRAGFAEGVEIDHGAVPFYIPAREHGKC